MLKKLAAHIASRDLFTKKNRLLLAISGGADSVALCHLLYELGYTLGLAHCNYGLRGEDSEKDEQFCNALAKKLKVPFFVKRMELNGKRSAISLQHEARQLRYNWFRQLCDENQYDFLVTAHHAGDQAETLLLNLLRGTGLKGMRGIAEKEGFLVRPLLIFTKEKILEYTKKNKISYRTDNSNLSEKYRRNFIRLKVMPLLKELNSSAETTMAENAARFSDEYRILQAELKNQADIVCDVKEEELTISKKKLLSQSAPESLLHYVLEPMGFRTSQENAIVRHLREKALPGKVFNSPTHRLSIDREKIVLRKKNASSNCFVEISSFTDLKSKAGMRVQRTTKPEKLAKHELLVSPDLIRWPLVLRDVKKGDKFIPFGMKGKKLLSDFMREQKLNLFEKEKVRLLVNGNGEIIWVVGFRSDERYRVTAGQKDLIKISSLE